MAADSKTEKATPKRRRDERKQGNVSQSKDVVNVIYVFVAFTVIQMYFPVMNENISKYMKEMFREVGFMTDFSNENITKYALDFMVAAVVSVLPVALACMATGVIMHGIQTKFLFTSKVLRPKLERLNPIEGVKKLFSLKNIVELLKNLIKTVILILIVYFLLIEYIVDVIRTMDMGIANAVAFTYELVMNMIVRVTMVFGVVAFLDYLYQRWDYERRIRMSKEDIKEEHKQTEGNPQIKGKIKETQRQMARRRMMQAVPNADVIIRNPTHYAIALKYDTSKNSAPIVLAKGMDELALRIIAVGEEHAVPVIENRPLARGLYEKTELNQEIPQEYYGAVAEILVYIYKLNNKLR